MAAVVYIMTIRGTVSSMTVPDIILAVLALAQVSYALRLEYVYSCAGGAVSKSEWGKGDCYYEMGQVGSLPVWTMQATGNGKGEKGNKRGRKGDETRKKKKTKEEKELGKRKKKEKRDAKKEELKRLRDDNRELRAEIARLQELGSVA
mmetsp:Transcript_6056/g.14197  ORF Transcript_6056/g.14197 Transcript_6056/m.14197 type:complete len:148 (+) Transcript_6056:129-572(+)